MSSKDLPIINITSYLECPACKEFVVCPIYGCTNGHIVCGICKDRIVVCPLCRDNNMTENAFLERVLEDKNVQIPCRNMEQGCVLQVTPAAMKIHLEKICEFRVIECREGRQACDGQSYHPQGLLSHWKDVHGIEKWDSRLPTTLINRPNGLLGAVLKRLRLCKEVYRNYDHIDAERITWRSGYVEIGELTISFHYITEGGFFKAWACVHDVEAVANQYSFDATLCGFQNKCEKRLTFPRIRMHSIQHYGSNKIRDLGDVCAVHVNTLKLIQDDENQSNAINLEWGVKINIYNVNG